MNEWQFWIDRGGTFTDVIGCGPQGELHTLKLISERPDQYPDAAIEGIRRLLERFADEPYQVRAVRMGTTVATNALLERRGEPTLLVTSAGLADVLRIGTQQRPDIFALDISLPEMLYRDVIEADERLDSNGNVIVALNETQLRNDLAAAAQRGLRSVAIVLMHSWRNAIHELRAAQIARDVGFRQVSMSHDVSATMRIVPRGDTTLIDAYLTPVLKKYVSGVESGLSEVAANTALEFMQSHGGLTGAADFRGCNSILSGPAGGVVGVANVAAIAGYERVIGFDMGGTSTDVALYAGQFERTSETVLSGVRITTPMLHIHTIAAGGGSIIKLENERLQVGPESAGANPGPAAYRNGGPLTLTDANILLGRIHTDHFPAVFGPNGDAPPDRELVRRQFSAMAAECALTPEQLAIGALDIAIERMAQAIAQISTRRGIDLEDFALCAFGGAGAQHACGVAAALGINTVVIHPLAGLLSALGIGLAERRQLRRQTVEQQLTEASLNSLLVLAKEMSGRLLADEADHESNQLSWTWQLHMKSVGADTTLAIPVTEQSTCNEVAAAFRNTHAAQFGYLPQPPTIVESLEVELAIGISHHHSMHIAAPDSNAAPVAQASVYFAGQTVNTPVYQRDGLAVNANVPGPAIIVETNSTIVVEPGWVASRDTTGNVILTHAQRLDQSSSSAPISTDPDPIRLELFNNAFMHAAEQMGVVLQRAAHSVNIKERLDYSCAVFALNGDLIANAPHIPVHLGSMGETVKALLADYRDQLMSGDVLMSNDPLHGGTHLPDVTVVTPVSIDSTREPNFIVASRAHHADVGGTTPGSMPPFSRTSDDEGALFHGVTVVRDGVFQADAVVDAFSSGPHPARNTQRNLSDIRAQIAANSRGVAELTRLATRYGLEQCQKYVRFMQANAAESVRRALRILPDGNADVLLDDGEQITVQIKIDHDQQTACIDFSGTSAMSSGNLNAPAAIARSAVLYTLRVLVAQDIPLNSGCLEPVEVVLPPRSLVNPEGKVAVVGGNVETSQRIVDALLRAFGVLASSQGTMNNLTFGDSQSAVLRDDLRRRGRQQAR